MSVTAVPIRPLKQGLAAQAVARPRRCWSLAAAASPGRDRPVRGRSDVLDANAVGPCDDCIGSRIEASEGRGSPALNDGAVIEYTGRLRGRHGVRQRPSGQRPAPMLVGRVVPGFSEALQQMQQGRQLPHLDPARARLWRAGPPGGVDPAQRDARFRRQRCCRSCANAALQMRPQAAAAAGRCGSSAGRCSRSEGGSAPRTPTQELARRCRGR